MVAVHWHKREITAKISQRLFTKALSQSKIITQTRFLNIKTIVEYFTLKHICGSEKNANTKISK